MEIRIKSTLLILLTFSLITISCKKEAQEDLLYGNDSTSLTIAKMANAVREDNMALGNPSNAKPNLRNCNNYLMVKTDYTLSYNKSKGTPNWVSWHLNSAWKGNAPRDDNFRADNTLPSGWTKVSPADYRNAGFDKGHMCPSEDRDFSTIENSETFLMTNMIPQAPINNQQTWRYLEAYCQNLAVSNGKELYIMAGPYGSGGTGSRGYATSISGGKVKVPSKVWKIIVILNEGNSDISRITTTTRVIAVILPNNQTVNSKPWGYYRVSVDAVETLTGYDFLSNVPDAIENVIEASVDNGPTQ